MSLQDAVYVSLVAATCGFIVGYVAGFLHGRDATRDKLDGNSSSGWAREKRRR